MITDRLPAISPNFRSRSGPVGLLRVRSCRRCLPKSCARQSPIRQCKQRGDLRHVLGQATTSDFLIAERTLERLKRILDLDADSDVHTFRFIHEHEVVDAGRRAHHGVRQPRVGIDANMCLHAKGPLVCLLGLMRLQALLSSAVLGRTRRDNARRIRRGATLEPRPIAGQRVLFEQVTKVQDADWIGEVFAVGQTRERRVQDSVEAGLIGDQLRPVKPLQREVDAQRHLPRKGRAPCAGVRRMWFDRPPEVMLLRHRAVHLVQKYHRLMCAPHTQVQTKVLLLHEVIILDTHIHAMLVYAGF